MNDIEPNTEARALAAELLARMTLSAEGDPLTFDESDPDTWAAADAAQQEVVRLGAVRFKIVGDAEELAAALGAVDADEMPVVCLRVAFEQAEGVPAPVVGQYIVVGTDEPNVSVIFQVRMTFDFLQADPDEPDLGPNAVRNQAIDVLQPGEGLLVQVFDADESEAA